MFIFEPVHDKWVQTARLAASDARNQDDFGNWVALSEDGNTLVVAADRQTLPSVLPTFGRSAGAVYVFQRVNGAWIQQAELFSPTPAAFGGFGTSGAGISGNTIAVIDGGGRANDFTPGIDVFTRVNGTWQLTTTLTVPEEFRFSPVSLAMSETTMVAGNLDDDISLGGSAYVFKYEDGKWTRRATLQPADPALGVSFGIGVAIDGNLIALGALLRRESPAGREPCTCLRVSKACGSKKPSSYPMTAWMATHSAALAQSPSAEKPCWWARTVTPPPLRAFWRCRLCLSAEGRRLVSDRRANRQRRREQWVFWRKRGDSKQPPAHRCLWPASAGGQWSGLSRRRSVRVSIGSVTHLQRGRAGRLETVALRKCAPPNLPSHYLLI